MDNGEIISRVRDSMYHQIKEKGMAVPVQLLMDTGVLSRQDYERWRFGKVDYLERVCGVNLSKLAFIMKQIKIYARENNMRESWTFYKQWGLKNKKNIRKLRFSKSGTESIERLYATHYIDPVIIAEIKKQKSNIEKESGA